MRIGMFSFAHVHAEGYLSLLRAMPDVQVVGFTHDGADAHEIAARHRLRHYDQAEALLAEGLDGVIVCSETSRHRDLVELAAASGTHVLCEKPIATTLEDAQAMRAACDSHGVLFMTAFPMRFDASCLEFRRSVRSGELGAVLGVNGVNHSENPSTHRAWFADRALAGGGAVMDHVVHLADLLRWGFESEVVEVYAHVHQAADAPADTAGVLLVTLANGVQASIDCSWSRPADYPRWGHLKLDVVGERGLGVFDAFAEHLTVYAAGASRSPEWRGFSVDPNHAMLRAFLDAVRDSAEPPVSWMDGYQALRVALAAYTSSETGQPVRLE